MTSFPYFTSRSLPHLHCHAEMERCFKHIVTPAEWAEEALLCTTGGLFSLFKQQRRRMLQAFRLRPNEKRCSTADERVCADDRVEITSQQSRARSASMCRADERLNLTCGSPDEKEKKKSHCRVQSHHITQDSLRLYQGFSPWHGIILVAVTDAALPILEQST